jgi:hypothetical protein
LPGKINTKTAPFPAPVCKSLRHNDLFSPGHLLKNIALPPCARTGRFASSITAISALR